MSICKKFIAVVLCCLCLTLSAQVFPVTASAAVPPIDIQPYWTTLSSIALSMSYSGGKVSWGGSIDGNSNVVSIKATYTLDILSGGSYSFVEKWDVSGTKTWLDSSGVTSGTPPTPKGTYRLTVNVTSTTSSGTVENTSTNLVKTFT